MATTIQWQYQGRDEAMTLLHECMEAWSMPQPYAGQLVLEMGCNESDWLSQMSRTYPETFFHGIDANRTEPTYPGVTYEQVSAWEYRPSQKFDQVYLLGALEHFGLGWYKDPKDPEGDRKTIDNIVANLLHPGGLLYYDVPYDPVQYSQTEHYRCYDDLALQRRLDHPRLVELARGYSKAQPEIALLAERPIESRYPFWFVARWLTLKP